MALNKLVRVQTDENGYTIYTMLQEEIEVKASPNSGFTPTLSYWTKEKEVTDDILKLRFSPTPPNDYIQNYEEFQSMLNMKEQQAIKELYESIQIKPKNMTPGKRVLWSSFVLLLIGLPLFIALLVIA